MNAYHSEFGLGSIIQDNGEELIVEFESGIKRCLRKTLELRASPSEKIANNQFDDFDKCAVRTEGALINTINDSWGVFSISRIELLPHQLWVCNQVLKRWPIRHMIADDVGLGKTIEAGLILWPLISSGRVNRLLILTPAALVEQWQTRLSSMFGIGLARYTTNQDTDGVNYWNTHNMVVASYSTLQLNNNNRHDHIFSAAPWDLIIFDEAHHMNADERRGKTLVYQFFEKMESIDIAPSRLLFTGTPHRGKEFGFFALMRLVEPAQFDPKEDLEQQYTQLSNYLIRNNKQNAADMEGNLLFKPIKQHPFIFEYSDEETEFYHQLTEFISSGKAYASTLSGRQNNQVVLVLIALQKIASSSVAAIRSALITRKAKFEREEAIVREKLTNLYIENIDEFEDDDEATKEYINILKEPSPLWLMQNEVEHLNKLIELSDRVKSESRIIKIIEIIKNQYHGDQVLLFTEYKRTQAAMINALRTEYGNESTGFINGDNYLLLGFDENNQPIELSKQRNVSAQDFNKGKIKFLVSTEAAGEGIDFQERCHVLIHIDLPWNPMRLHQRVGRLNRYGQKQAVDVISLRNPDTVEARIWQKLETKIASIVTAFGAIMEEPEDLFNLVLGMEGSNFYNNLFFDASAIKDEEKFSRWFDAETQTLGGDETIKTIEKMIGQASKFNLSGLNGVPKLDLPDLEPFFKRSIKLANRRLTISEDNKYSFITPDEWKTGYGISPKYENIFFRRKLNEGEETKSIFGVGQKIFQKALEFASKYEDDVCLINSPCSYFVYRIYDKITDYPGIIKSHYLAAELNKDDKIRWLSEVDFFPILKNFDGKTDNLQEQIDIRKGLEKIETRIVQEVRKFSADYKKPGYELFTVFLTNSLSK